MASMPQRRSSINGFIANPKPSIFQKSGLTRPGFDWPKILYIDRVSLEISMGEVLASLAPARSQL